MSESVRRDKILQNVDERVLLVGSLAPQRQDVTSLEI